MGCGTKEQTCCCFLLSCLVWCVKTVRKQLLRSPILRTCEEQRLSWAVRRSWRRSLCLSSMVLQAGSSAPWQGGTASPTPEDEVSAPMRGQLPATHRARWVKNEREMKTLSRGSNFPLRNQSGSHLPDGKVTVKERSTHPLTLSQRASRRERELDQRQALATLTRFPARIFKVKGIHI